MRGVHAPALRAPESHVDLVGALFIVWGGLTILIGVCTLALGLAAASVIPSSADTGRSQVAAGFITGVFIALAVLAMIWGAAHASVGMLVRRRRHWSRLGALLLGSVDLVLLPYGTALGLYTLFVLLRDDTRKYFEAS